MRIADGCVVVLAALLNINDGVFGFGGDENIRRDVQQQQHTWHLLRSKRSYIHGGVGVDDKTRRTTSNLFEAYDEIGEVGDDVQDEEVINGDSSMPMKVDDEGGGDVTSASRDSSGDESDGDGSDDGSVGAGGGKDKSNSKASKDVPTVSPRYVLCYNAHECTFDVCFRRLESQYLYAT